MRLNPFRHPGILQVSGSILLLVAAVAAEDRPLFKPAPSGLAKTAAKAFPSGPFVAREAHAALDWHALAGGGGTSPASVAERLRLNLFPDFSVTAERIRLTWQGPGRFTWVGRIGADPVILSAWDGALHGMVESGGRVFEIETLPGTSRLQRIAEQDQAAFAGNEAEHPDACGSQEPTPEPALENSPVPRAPGAPDPVIDVMILYDEAVASRTADMKAYLNSLIAMSNESYRLSGIPQTVRLVHSAQVASGLTGNHNSWLGQDARVKAWRDEYGADLVAMLVETGFSYCGVASSAFTTTKRSCAVGNKTFTHELGHNMGAGHAWEQFTTHNGYAYGYINHEKSWRTVMSYAECEEGGRCTRILNFSNPDILYNGDPTGIADSRDNARRMRSRTLALSNNRPTKVGGPVAIEWVSPAPVKDPFALRRLSPTSAMLRLQSAAFLSADLLDLDGRVHTLAQGRFPAGETQLEWGSLGLPTGLRVLRIRDPQGQTVIKLPPWP